FEARARGRVDHVVNLTRTARIANKTADPGSRLLVGTITSCNTDTMIVVHGLGEIAPNSIEDRALGPLLGLALGDALGTTYEFEVIDQPRFPRRARGPAIDITGGGPFELAAGAVTDDTQLAVCLARSLAATHRQLDPDEVARRYVAWSAHAFDIGNQTAGALRAIERGAAPLAAGHEVWRASGRRAAGNGSLMRTAPIG